MEHEHEIEALETFEKLENFKRFIIAIFIIGIFALATLALGGLIIIAAWKEDYPSAIEAAKWLIALLAAVVSGITGFYFGSHSTEAKPNAPV